jgi:hypothetical protein
MDQKAHLAQETVAGVGQISCRLEHPRFAGLWDDASNVDFPGHQAYHEEDVISHQSDGRPHFDGEEIRRRHRAPMNSEKFLPSHSLAPIWRWIPTGFAQNVGDRAASDLVSQIGQGTLDARISP